jgi:DNA-binding protein Fis
MMQALRNCRYATYTRLRLKKVHKSKSKSLLVQTQWPTVRDLYGLVLLQLEARLLVELLEVGLLE